MEREIGGTIRKQMPIKLHKLRLLVGIAGSYGLTGWRRECTKCFRTLASAILKSWPPIHCKSWIKPNHLTDQHCLIKGHIMGYNKIGTTNNVYKLRKYFGCWTTVPRCFILGDAVNLFGTLVPNNVCGGLD